MVGEKPMARSLKSMTALFFSVGFGLMVVLTPMASGDDTKNEAGIKATLKAKDAKADGTQEVTITLEIPSPYHLYANPVGHEDLESVQTKVTVTGKSKPKDVKVEYPKGKLVIDALVGNHSVYEGKVVIPLKLVRADKEELTVQIKYQACDDKKCLPPATMKLTLK